MFGPHVRRLTTIYAINLRLVVQHCLVGISKKRGQGFASFQHKYVLCAGTHSMSKDVKLM